MKEYIIELKDNSYDNKFQYLLKQNFIKYDNLIDKNQYVIKLNNAWGNYIKRLYFIKTFMYKPIENQINMPKEKSNYNDINYDNIDSNYG